MSMQDWKSGVQQALRATQANLLRGPQGFGSEVKQPTEQQPNTMQGAAGLMRQLGESCNALRAQARSHSAELDLERTVREDTVRELARRTQHEIAELREIVKQLRNDNIDIKKSVYDLEKRPTMKQLSHLDDPFSASHASSSALLPRVAELEAAVGRQQRVLEDRSRRHDALINDSITAKVDNEVEKIRSVAREAARESTEDLVKLRMHALQAMFTTELQNMSDSYQKAKDQASAVERVYKDSAREHVSTTLALNQRIDLAMEGRDKWDKLQVEVHEIVRAQLDTERVRMDDVVSILRGEMASLSRRYALEATEQHHSMQHYVTQRIDVLTTQSASREEVQRMIQNCNAAVETDLVLLKKSSMQTKQLLDETRIEMNKLVGCVDAQVADTRRGIEELTHARALEQQTLQRVQVENEEVRGKIRGAVSAVDDFSSALHEAQSSIVSLKQDARHAQEDLKRQAATLTDADTTLSRRLEFLIDESAKKTLQAVSVASLAESQETKKNIANLEASTMSKIAQLSQSATEVRTQLQGRLQQGLDTLTETVSALNKSVSDVSSSQHEADHSIKSVTQKLQDLRDTVSRDMDDERAASKESVKLLHVAINEKIQNVKRAINDEQLQPALQEVGRDVASLRDRVAKLSTGVLDLPHLEARVDAVSAQAKEAGVKTDDVHHKLRMLLERAGLESAQLIKQKIDSVLEEVHLTISRNNKNQEDATLATTRKFVDDSLRVFQSQRNQSSTSNEAMEAHSADVEVLREELTRLRTDVGRTAGSFSRLQQESNARHDQVVATAREQQSQLHSLDERVTSCVVQTRSVGGVAPSSSAVGNNSAASAVIEREVRRLQDDNAVLHAKHAVHEEQLLEVTHQVLELSTRFQHSQSAQDDVDASAGGAATVQDIEAQRSSQRVLAEKFERLQDAIEDTRISTEEVVSSLQQSINDLSRNIEDCVVKFVECLRSSGNEQDASDANAVTRLVDVFSVLVARTASNEDTLVTLSENLLSTVDLVQRHEGSFSSIRELAEAISFNAQNIVTLASAVGLDKSAFTLQLNYDSFGDGSSLGGTIMI